MDQLLQEFSTGLMAAVIAALILAAPEAIPASEADASKD